MKISSIYFLLFLAGTLLPLVPFAGFLIEYGLDVNMFLTLLFINKISSFFALDVLVSAGVVIAFIIHESRTRTIRSVWVCFMTLFLVGVSSALPLFLYLRETNRSLNSST